MADEIKFCPNCGSTNVEPDTSNRAEIFFSGGMPNKWRCNDCKYVGLMPEGDPDEDFDENFEENVEFGGSGEIERVDTGFGRGYLKYLIYVSLPVLLVYLFYLLYL